MMRLERSGKPQYQLQVVIFIVSSASSDDWEREERVSFDAGCARQVYVHAIGFGRPPFYLCHKLYRLCVYLYNCIFIQLRPSFLRLPPRPQGILLLLRLHKVRFFFFWRPPKNIFLSLAAMPMSAQHVIYACYLFLWDPDAVGVSDGSGRCSRAA